MQRDDEIWRDDIPNESSMGNVKQESLTPSAKNVNTIMPVIGDSNLTAEDVFTGINIAASALTLRTDMPDDSGIGWQKGRVQP